MITYVGDVQTMDAGLLKLKRKVSKTDRYIQLTRQKVEKLNFKKVGAHWHEFPNYSKWFFK